MTLSNGNDAAAADDDDPSRPDREALGINFHGEALQKKLQQPPQPNHKPRKVTSKSNQKKFKKQQQQQGQKDLQDSMRLR